MEYLVLFYTQAGAIKFQRHLFRKKIICDLQPIPRKLSSSCGLAIHFHYAGELGDLLDSDVDKVYLLTAGEYVLCYAADEEK